MGENDFKFTSALTKLSMPPLLSSRFGDLNENGIDRRLGGVDPTKLHADYRIISHVQNKHLDRFAWIFPEMTSNTNDHDSSFYQNLLLETFHSLALLRTTIAAPVKWIFAIALQNDQFSSWSVSQSASRVGWRLCAWSRFDPASFPNSSSSNNVTETRRIVTMESYGDHSLIKTTTTTALDTRFYVFELEGSL
eukprot:CAMPEP_0202463926 /NCGR_PEP_ID=MMETSP1360-20130828/59980_1 /ASSEMBLY_ACC=CAM_ASM_000848 /TAXON_ID=515479 /ORGANISM="Licmophora paradoxa, Strain CCMP2313" /LENGTH=192 /DNA_ID=CAMNT_0049086985 /DNA_START=64 /DNA_END=642 /DNA_ORIENTATION=+